MVQQYKTKSHFDIPYSALCPVYFYRYPNPIATHVLSVDVIAREIITRPVVSDSSSSSSSSQNTREGQQQQHVLKTTRLILKKGTLPRWAPRGLIRNAESWVLEESEIELDGLSPESIEWRGGGGGGGGGGVGVGKGREMRAWTRNLDHTTVMAVTESNIFREKLYNSSSKESHNNNNNNKGISDGSVGLKSLYDVTSGVSFGLLRSRIEKFGLNRVVTHVDTSRQGILSTYQRLLEERSGGVGLLAAAAGKEIGAGRGEVSDVQKVASKRARLLAALRPPFLDGDFVGPVARTKRRFLALREWWRTLDRGGTGDESNFRVRSSSQRELQEQNEQSLTPMERLRKRLLKLREQSRTAFINKGQDMDEVDDDEF